MKGLQLTAYGDPSEVVKLVDVREVGAPGPDEVVIDVEASPVEPTGLYTIAGVYGYLPPPPHLLGAQGVGRVSAAGRDVRHLREGDRALVPVLGNAWASQVKTSAPWLRPPCEPTSGDGSRRLRPPTGTVSPPELSDPYSGAGPAVPKPRGS
jgi:NADPH:quinone reductase-like Zn-dependent oxidoreductase